jgi:Uma2 family endonuclease
MASIQARPARIPTDPYNKSMGAFPQPKVSVDEYFRMDRVSEVPLEFHDGDVFPISSVSFAHGVIAANLSRALGNRLTGIPCRTLIQVRVRASASNYVRPDVAVVCGEPQLTDSSRETLVNPKIVFEILSPSTADYDYGGKFALYRKVRSIEEYVLISQYVPVVEIFRRQPDESWTLHSIDKLDGSVELGSLQITLPLAEIYQGLTLNEPSE